MIGLRTLVLILTFVPGPTFNFSEVTALQPFELLGKTVMTIQGTPSPWARMGEISVILIALFLGDASVRLWRRGGRAERRRALVIGGGMTLFIVIGAVNSLLIHTGAMTMPYLISFNFIFVVAAMAMELSRDLVRAGYMADELRENAESMSLAAGAASIALWRWDMEKDHIWVSPYGRNLYGVAEDEQVSLSRFLETLHPDD